MTLSTLECNETSTPGTVYRYFTVPENSLGRLSPCQNIYGNTTNSDGEAGWDCTEFTDSYQETCREVDDDDRRMYKSLSVNADAPAIMGCRLYTSDDCVFGDQGSETTEHILEVDGASCVEVAEVAMNNIVSVECVSLVA